jgi:hypothetical protein
MAVLFKMHNELQDIDWLQQLGMIQMMKKFPAVMKPENADC